MSRTAIGRTPSKAEALDDDDHLLPDASDDVADGAFSTAEQAKLVQGVPLDAQQAAEAEARTWSTEWQAFAHTWGPGAAVRDWQRYSCRRLVKADEGAQCAFEVDMQTCMGAIRCGTTQGY